MPDEKVEVEMVCLLGSLSFWPLRIHIRIGVQNGFALGRVTSLVMHDTCVHVSVLNRVRVPAQST